MKKVLIIGRGFLGDLLFQKFSEKKFLVESTNLHKREDSSVLDITDKSSVDNFFEKSMPDLVINCAVTKNLDFLENQPELAFSINSQGAKNVASSSKKISARLIHISTDSVFNGLKSMYQESSTVNPINVYAKSKTLGENLIKETLSNFVIIRTNFFGINPRGDSLLNWILDSLNNRKKITGFSDVVFNPLEISNLADMILEISFIDYNGILHLASDEPLSKYDFIIKVSKIFGFNEKLIIKDSIDSSYNLIAKRPKNTTLDNIIAKNLLHTKIIPLEYSLQKIHQQYIVNKKIS